MGVKDKLINALQKSLHAEYIRLDDDDGISGFVVSREFEQMSTLDRQQLIEHALEHAEDGLTGEEQRQILMIAGLTPQEYESVATQITVREIRESGDDWLEIVLLGGYSDATYVRGALNNQKGVTTSEPEQSSDALGVAMAFRARGTDVNPLSKDKAIRILVADPYIHVLQNA